MLVRIVSERGFYLGHGADNSLHQANFKEAGVWEEEKAEKVLKNLPNYLTRFGPYKLEPATDCDITTSRISKNDENSKSDMSDNNVLVGSCPLSEEVQIELEGLTDAFNTLKDVPIKLNELESELKDLDNKRLDLLHIIEIEPPKNMHQGYLLYKELREVSLRRRRVKDLIMVYTAWRNAFKLNDSSNVVVSSVEEALTDRRYYFRSTDTK